MGNETLDAGGSVRAPRRRAFISLASRLALVIFGLVAAVSLAVALELARRERDHYVESKRNAGVMLTELFAASVAPALDFADAEALRSSLEMLQKNREVIEAGIWADEGQAPLTLTGQGLLPQARPSADTFIAHDYIDVLRAVVSPTGKELGVVLVRVSLARENAAFRAARQRILWMAFCLSALVAALLVAVVRRTIVSPLAELEKAARRLAGGELGLVMAGREDEIGSLGRTFNGMARAIFEREDRISDMNARLQGLLDNMRQAIVVFDSEGHLAPERSRLARHLFGDAAGPDTTIADLLYPAERSPEVEREAFCVWLAALAEASQEEFEELLPLAPREVTWAAPSGEERVFELEFRRAPRADGLERFMLLATDMTSQRKLQQSAEEQALQHQKQLAAMRRLVAGGGQIFVTFLGSARERLSRSRRLLVEQPGLPPPALEEAFAFVHTLRAEARSFDLEGVERLASKLELELSGARHTPLDSPLRRAVHDELVSGTERLSHELDAAENLFVQSSPIGRRVLEQVTVSRRDVQELFRRAGGRGDEIGRLAGRLAARPFGEILATLPEAVRRWGEKEGKLIELCVEGRESLVPAPLCDRLGGVLAHLLRNAVAHGIQMPASRRARGKPEAGRIELCCEERVDGVSIVVDDDGEGFDLVALERAAAAQGYRADGTLELAFLGGVSTRGSADELAGFGVGLGAAREELERSGYTVRLSRAALGGARVLIEALPAEQGSRTSFALASAAVEVKT